MTQTLTHSNKAEGWVSFYSYHPDWMIGMNNYFYTFKNGNLYRHNTNSIRNNFYGVQYSSTIRSVFNDMPLENKLFKTLRIEGDDTWSAELATDIEDTGYVEANWFEKKEQSYFAFVRNSGTSPASIGEYSLRSMNGVGKSSSVSGNTINFPMEYKINNIMSIGDMLYFAEPPYTSPQLAGQVTAINRNPQQGVNSIEIDLGTTGAVPIPIQDAFFLFIKNAVSESHGVLGHYCVFDIENTSTEPINLFVLGSEVMKSYP